MKNIINKTNTCLCKNIKVNIIFRHMETTGVAYDNAFAILDYLYSNGREPTKALEDHAMRAMFYVSECIDKNLTFSQIVLYSKDALGYRLHRDSFVAIIEAIRHKMKDNFLVIIENGTDDLNLYSKKTYNLLVNWKMSFNFNMSKEDLPLPITLDLENTIKSLDQAIVENNLSDKESVSSTSSTENEDTHLPLVDNNIQKENIPDTYSDSALFNNSNNNEIMLLTVLAFGVIISIAWLVRKYYPETLSSDHDEEQTSLHSVHEFMIDLNKCLLQLSLILIPTTLYILYQYRYYYYYKLITKSWKQ